MADKVLTQPTSRFISSRSPTSQTAQQDNFQQQNIQEAPQEDPRDVEARQAQADLERLREELASARQAEERETRSDVRAKRQQRVRDLNEAVARAELRAQGRFDEAEELRFRQSVEEDRTRSRMERPAQTSEAQAGKTMIRIVQENPTRNTHDDYSNISTGGGSRLVTPQGNTLIPYASTTEGLTYQQSTSREDLEQIRKQSLPPEQPSFLVNEFQPHETGLQTTVKQDDAAALKKVRESARYVGQMGVKLEAFKEKVGIRKPPKDVLQGIGQEAVSTGLDVGAALVLLPASSLVVAQAAQTATQKPELAANIITQGAYLVPAAVAAGTLGFVSKLARGDPGALGQGVVTAATLGRGGFKSPKITKLSGATAGEKVAGRAGILRPAPPSKLFGKPVPQSASVLDATEAQLRTDTGTTSILKGQVLTVQKAGRSRQKYVAKFSSSSLESKPVALENVEGVSKSGGDIDVSLSRIVQGRALAKPVKYGSVLKTGKISRLSKPVSTTIKTKGIGKQTGESGYDSRSIGTFNLKGKQYTVLGKSSGKRVGEPESVEGMEEFRSVRNIPGTKQKETAVIPFTERTSYASEEKALSLTKVRGPGKRLRLGLEDTTYFDLTKSRVAGSGRGFGGVTVLARKAPELGSDYGPAARTLTRTRTRPTASISLLPRAAEVLASRSSRRLASRRRGEFVKDFRYDQFRAQKVGGSPQRFGPPLPISRGGFTDPVYGRARAPSQSRYTSSSSLSSQRIGEVSLNKSRSAARSRSGYRVARNLGLSQGEFRIPAAKGLLGVGQFSVQGQRQGQRVGLRSLQRQGQRQRTARKLSNVPFNPQPTRTRLKPPLPTINFSPKKGYQYFEEDFLGYREINKPIPGPRAVILGKKRGVDISL